MQQVTTSDSRQRRVVQIVEDDPNTSQSMVGLLEPLDVACTTFNSAELFLEANERDPDGFLILDLGLNGRSGLELLKLIRNRGWTVPVLVVSGTTSVNEATEAMKYGILDFVEKPILARKFVSIVEMAVSVRPETGTNINGVLVKERMAELEDLDREVLRLMLKGEQNKVIASQLDIGLRSAVRYRKQILDTFRVSSLTDLVRVMTLAGITDGIPLKNPSFATPLPQRLRHDFRSKLNAAVLNLQLYKLQLEQSQFEEAQITCERIELALQRLVDDSSSFSPLSISKDGGGKPFVLLMLEDQQEASLLAGIMKLNEFLPEICHAYHDAIESLNDLVDEPPTFVVTEYSEDKHEAAMAFINKIKSMSEYDNTAIIVFTNSDPESVPEILRSKVDDFFKRPVNPLTLANAMFERMIQDRDQDDSLG